jgi:hypothetical protein
MLREHSQSGEVAPVRNEDFLGSVLNSATARDEFRHHSRGCVTAAHETVDLAQGDIRDRRVLTIEDAGSRPGDDQTTGPQTCGEMCRKRVCVDIEELATARRADARHHGHVTLSAKIDEKGWLLFARRLTDPAEVDDGAARRTMQTGGRHAPDRRVGAGKTDRLYAGSAERRDEPGIHETGKHADDDIERRLIRNAQSVHLAFFDSGA